MHHAVSAWRWGWDEEPYSGAGFPAHGLGGILTHALAGAGTKTPPWVTTEGLESMRQCPQAMTFLLRSGQ